VVSDIRLSVEFFHSLSTRKLLRLLGAEGVIALLKIWIYAANHHPTGNLEGILDDDLATVADWPGEPSALVAALEASGYVLRNSEGFSLRDWDLLQPWASTQAERSNAAKVLAQKRWMRGACVADAKGNAPSLSFPSPIPNPSPIPKPSPLPKTLPTSIGGSNGRAKIQTEASAGIGNIEGALARIIEKIQIKEEES
jgi:hypothetical protein